MAPYATGTEGTRGDRRNARDRVLVVRNGRAPSVSRLAGDRRLPPPPGGGGKGADCSVLAATQARNDRASLCALRAGGRPMAVPTTQDGGECGFARGERGRRGRSAGAIRGWLPMRRGRRARVGIGEMRGTGCWWCGTDEPLPSASSRGIGGCHLPRRGRQGSGLQRPCCDTGSH